MNVAALIPARKGSKGIPNKNFKNFCGKTLLKWAYDAANESGIFNRIIISTDNKDIDGDAILAKDIIGCFKTIIDKNRPPELSNDTASLDDLLVYYSKMYPDIDLWCLLQPTSPLRTAEDIRQAFAMMEEKDATGDYKYESIVSVYSHPVLAWIDNAVGIPGSTDAEDIIQPVATYHYTKRPNRQERSDWYLENGAIYFTRKYILEYFKSRLHGTIGLYVMPKERSVEIDDLFDWQLCEWLMEQELEEI